jgi:hypothetical protein
MFAHHLKPPRVIPTSGEVFDIGGDLHASSGRLAHVLMVLAHARVQDAGEKHCVTTDYGRSAGLNSIFVSPQKSARNQRRPGREREIGVFAALPPPSPGRDIRTESKNNFQAEV